MLAEDNTVLRQLELTIKKAAFRIRKDGEFDSRSLLALAKLSKEYRELYALQQTIDDDDDYDRDFYSKLESGEACQIKNRED
jgi:hypothetical protein